MDDTTQTENETAKTGGWWKRLSGGLGRTSSSLGSAITGLVSNRRLDEATLEELEAELIRADLGQDVAFTIADALGQAKANHPKNDTQFKNHSDRIIIKIRRHVMA